MVILILKLIAAGALILAYIVGIFAWMMKPADPEDHINRKVKNNKPN